MDSGKRLFKLFALFFGLVICIGCNTSINENAKDIDRIPEIEPDYSEVTIPPNIAPMNFVIKEDGSSFSITASSSKGKHQINIKSSDGIIRFPEKSWRKLIKECQGDKIEIQIYASDKDNNVNNRFEPIFMYVSDEPVDPYLTYRLILPGYYNVADLRIVQRDLESFWEKSLLENQMVGGNCINCHNPNQNNPEQFLLHIRGSNGGTYFFDDGKIIRRNLRTENMSANATYPAWHPGGKFVAFASNAVRQSFYANPDKNIEVWDIFSSMILYDIDNNETSTIPDPDTLTYLETFPSWSPDGKYLYYARAIQDKPNTYQDLDDIENSHFNLVRKSFDAESRTFGETEIVFNAAEVNKSASFPRISPDGKYLVFNLQAFGTFPVMRQDADLYILNMENGEYKEMSINSNESESYHTWSTNSKWLVFSSKRLDSRSARPHFAYIESWDRIGKPFVLPQKDPTLYDRLLESFNIPEFVTGRTKLDSRDFAAAMKQEAIQANSGDLFDTLEYIRNMRLIDTLRESHE